jgi:molybdopterin molybdotransferase
MRPGKPLMAGRLDGVPMLGLPGNPVSAVVCGHLFLLPMVRAMLGDPAPAPQARRARLATDVSANGPRAHYMRSRLILGEGMPEIAPFDRQDSALLSVLGEADALLIRPVADGPRGKGSTVDYLPI